MATKKRAKAATEWVTGIVSLPQYVTGEGEPFRPDLLLWIDQDGLIVGMNTARPGELSQRVAQHFRETTRRPLMGPSRAPTRIRVASAELADTLRAELGKTIEVVCAPTPELGATIAAMIEQMDENDEEQTFLTPDLSAAAMAAFFHAAAGLFRAKPWGVVPDDQSLLSVTVEALGVRDTVISIIGHAEESFGLILFSDLDTFEAYIEVAIAMAAGEMPPVPPHFGITFESRDDRGPALLAEIAEQGWEVAGPDAYPSLVIVDKDVVGRMPTAKELALAEVIALALPKVLAEEQALLRAWAQGEAFSRTLTVTAHTGPIEVTLSVLNEAASSALEEGLSDDLMKAFARLQSHGGELDIEAREKLEEALLRRFYESPEANALKDIQSCQLVMEFAADYFGETIPALTSAHLREIVFEIIPRKLTTDASEGPTIIAELLAFFTFLKREFALAQADACLAVLGGDAAKQLTRALSDPRNFGPAKSIMMAGRGAGFDIDSREGAEAWMREVQGKPLPSFIQLPLLPGPAPRRVDTAAESAKKTKRQARKKSRRRMLS